MLEKILKKLNCSSMEEYFEKEDRKRKRFPGMEVDWESPLLQLSDEEFEYLEKYVMPFLYSKKEKEVE